MRGRRPTPPQLRILAGTLTGEHASASQVLPEGEPPVPPDDLTEAQREAWDHAVQHAPRGLLTRLDRELVRQYAVADLAECARRLRDEGAIIGVGDFRRPNPWVRVRRDAFDRMLKLSTELGLSPTSRARIRLGTKAAGNRFRREP